MSSLTSTVRAALHLCAVTRPALTPSRARTTLTTRTLFFSGPNNKSKPPNDVPNPPASQQKTKAPENTTRNAAATSCTVGGGTATTAATSSSGGNGGGDAVEICGIDPDIAHLESIWARMKAGTEAKVKETEQTDELGKPVRWDKMKDVQVVVPVMKEGDGKVEAAGSVEVKPVMKPEE